MASWKLSLPRSPLGAAWLRPQGGAGCSRPRAGRCMVVRSELSSGGPSFGLFVECDLVLTNAHIDGHRVAFNKAFEALGLDCVSWAPGLYQDLLRTGNGSAEGLLAAYFNTVGWPMTVASKERNIFVRKVHEHKQRALAEMVAATALPLRPGVQELLQTAQADGASVAVLAATASAPEEQIASAALRALSPLCAAQIRVFTCTPSSPAQDEESGQESPAPLNMEQHLAAAAAQVKQAEAAAFVASMTRAEHWGSGPDSFIGSVGVDPSILAASQRRASMVISPAWLAALAATLGVPLSRCALLGASTATLEAAQGAGALSVAVPPAMSARGRFPSADVSFEGIGPGGGATWPRIRALIEARAAGAQAQGQ